MQEKAKGTQQELLHSSLRKKKNKVDITLIYTSLLQGSLLIRSSQKGE